MKKWAFCVLVLLLLGYAFVKFKVSDLSAIPLDKITLTDDNPQAPADRGFTIKITGEQVYRGDLLLVNQDHPVPDQGPEEEALSLVQHDELLQGFGVMDNTVRLSERLAGKFIEMAAAAGEDGVNHFLITSGYRDERRQDELYRQMGAEYAMPAGYSEHNLGLSLDIGSSEAEMNVAPEGKWLKENAWKYGFVLRYPENKTAVTGIQYEPWHFRYVGLPHSAIMQRNDMVLEEYLNYLKVKQAVKADVNGQTYHVFYFPVTDGGTIRVPVEGSYELSGNNVDGVIVTVHEE
ncbi:MAG: M15 family metallopeptidase [Paenibacillus macerans]|uniref:M15 family metallopeptidase n=1 Tax=Paenibacillus TaxID=44249 RepID=UPI002914A001|nr:M15 family metallopeptidase [Paenibacillus macerans]MDU7471747.1 M15 family metallopeptidase [Paenibacillus macerans]